MHCTLLISDLAAAIRSGRGPYRGFARCRMLKCCWHAANGAPQPRARAAKPGCARQFGVPTQPATGRSLPLMLRGRRRRARCVTIGCAPNPSSCSVDRDRLIARRRGVARSHRSRSARAGRRAQRAFRARRPRVRCAGTVALVLRATTRTPALTTTPLDAGADRSIEPHLPQAPTRSRWHARDERSADDAARPTR